MNHLSRWNPRSWKRKHPASHTVDLQLEAASASGLDDLQARLNHWSRLWSAEDESSSNCEAQQLVAQRLHRWMERCFGQHVPDSLRGKGHGISLASSTPIFTAFLGRRATRELSRRVLQDV